MPPLSGTYNPSAVMLNRGQIGPYLWSGKGATPPQSPIQSGKETPKTTSTPPSNMLAPEAIRATGKGPFDASYRQNLATYAGGQFSRPGGSMNFNPTDPSTFPGQPVGGGNAPLPGLPTSLMDTALAGQGFSYQPPPPANTAQAAPQFGGIQSWMDQFMRNGRGMRFGTGVNANG